MRLLPTIQSPADLKRLPVERLPDLAAEIREAIIGQVSRTGGHLAPNLGVVELTIALHYVFDFSRDRLLFDVGHQCYPHKLLTGRQDQLPGLRTSKGMSGFPAPGESPFDLFAVGHAGTAISTGVGMARGDTLASEAFDPRTNADGRRVVAMIGDASIVNGLAMEGLNNAGTLNRQFLVVLNDNGMSIAKPQGAVAGYFDRLRLSDMYKDFKQQAQRVLGGIPGGSLLGEAYHRAGEATKAMIAEHSWFENFGLLTVGPIDGHDLPTLIEFLAEAKDFNRPMLLHAKTIKGKGFSFAEQNATMFHSPAAFEIKTQPDRTDIADPDREDLGLEHVGCTVEIKKKGRSFTAAFGDAMGDLMARDEKVVACTAAMPDGTGLAKVMPTFPDRTWDVGICESHAMDMMAGLAKTGFRPFFAVYSTFLQRAFDQAFQEVALQGLAVRLCLDRAGLVGSDGAVHHGFYDISLMRVFPDAAITAAIDEPSLRAALEFMRTYDDGLSAVRYPRDIVSQRFVKEPCPPFALGKARRLWGDTQSADAAVLAFGVPAITAVDVAENLERQGVARVVVYDARFAKPVDEALVADLLTRNLPIITIEDHGLPGGFGAAVLEAGAKLQLDTSRVTRLGVHEAWIMQDARASQLAEVGIDAVGVERAILAAVGGRARIEASAESAGAHVRVRTGVQPASTVVNGANNQ